MFNVYIFYVSYVQSPNVQLLRKKLGVATLSIAANELGVVIIYFTSANELGVAAINYTSEGIRKTTGYFNLKSPTLDLMRRGSQGLGRNDVIARSQAVVSRNTYTIHDLMIDGALNNVLILVVSSISLLLYWPIK